MSSHKAVLLCNNLIGQASISNWKEMGGRGVIFIPWKIKESEEQHSQQHQTGKQVVPLLICYGEVVEARALYIRNIEM